MLLGELTEREDMWETYKADQVVKGGMSWH